MSRLRDLEAAEKVRGEVEKIRLAFVLGQIDTAFTLARSARTFYLSGLTRRAYDIQRQAWQAYHQAEEQLKILPVEQKLRDLLTCQISETRAALEALMDLRIS